MKVYSPAGRRDRDAEEDDEDHGFLRTFGHGSWSGSWSGSNDQHPESPLASRAPVDLDPWTQYELERETHKIQYDMDKKNKTSLPASPMSNNNNSKTSNIKGNCISKKNSSDRSSLSEKSRRNSGGGTSITKAYAFGLPRHNDSVHKAIQDAKERRKSLLCEVTVRKLYEGHSHRDPGRAVDLAASMSHLSMDDDEEEDSDDDFQFNNSCIF